MAGAACGRWGTGASRLSDIFADQPTDADQLAELYDLEHDAVTEDLVFYREMAQRSPGAVLDLGCGSGRLFRSLLEGGASRLVGIDGSGALLRRARMRIAADPVLAAAMREGRVELRHGDVRGVWLRERFALVVAAGLLPHLDGPADADRLLRTVRELLTLEGRVVIDLPGPGGLPRRDLPLSLDWRREVGDRTIVRRSQLARRETPDGLRVVFSTIVDVEQHDGTMARLPASYRLWYPEREALARLVREAGLVVEMTHGSHDLEPLDHESERCIVLARRPATTEHE